uniref:Uncharacterized protein n=1 Tax=Raoultella ornithinolytica TaxID=54291 RepID=A0A3T0VFL8_RAOOR|nr:hypothetical protein [Raoultella ornithinolytica]
MIVLILVFRLVVGVRMVNILDPENADGAVVQDKNCHYSTVL